MNRRTFLLGSTSAVALANPADAARVHPGGAKLGGRPPTNIITTFSLQNTLTRAATGAHVLSWGQAFLPGEVSSGRTISVSLTGFTAPSVQLDPKTFYADGSVEHGIVSMLAPSLPANASAPGGGAISGQFTAVSSPSATPIDPVAVLATSYTLSAALAMNARSPILSGLGTATLSICAPSGNNSLLEQALADKATFTGTFSAVGGVNTLTVSGVTGTIKVGHRLTSLVTGTTTPFDMRIISGSGTTWQCNGLPIASKIGPISMQSAAFDYFRQGPVCTEIRFEKAIGGSLRLVVDYARYADGTNMFDLQWNNDVAKTGAGGNVFYDLTITQNGSRVVSWTTRNYTGGITAYTNNNGLLSVSITDLAIGSAILGTGVLSGTYVYESTGVSGQYHVQNSAGGSQSTVAKGTALYSPGVTHHLYACRHDVIWSNGAPWHNIVRDVSTFQKAFLFAPLDLQYKQGNILAQLHAIYQAAPTSDPFPKHWIDCQFEAGGSDPSLGQLGFNCGPASIWQITQDKRAERMAMLMGENNTSINFHIYDGGSTKGPAQLSYLPVDKYNAVWVANPINTTGNPLTENVELAGQFTPNAAGFGVAAGIQPLNAHLMDFCYTLYSLTGCRHFLDELVATANVNLWLMWTANRAWFSGSGNYSGNAPSGTPLDVLFRNPGELRAGSWGLRNYIMAETLSPDGGIYKSYFAKRVSNNLGYMAGKAAGTVTDGFPLNVASSVTHGWWPDENTRGTGQSNGTMAPWEHTYLIWAVGFAVRRGYNHPTSYSNAKPVLDFIANAAIQPWLPQPSYDRYWSANYQANVFKLSTNQWLTPWSAINPSVGGPGSSYQGPWCSNGNGGVYGELEFAKLNECVSLCTGVQQRDAMQGLGWLVTQQDYQSAGANSNYGASRAASYGQAGYGWNSPQYGSFNFSFSGQDRGFFTDPEHSFRVQRSDGSTIYRNRIQWTVAGGTLMAVAGGANIMAAIGTRAATLVGGTGADILGIYTTAGANEIHIHGAGTFACGTVDGGTGTLLMKDGPGGNFMRAGNGGANTFRFPSGLTGSGTTTEIEPAWATTAFRLGTDKIQVDSSLVGGASAASVLAAATISGSDTLLHLTRINKTVQVDGSVSGGVTTLTTTELSVGTFS